GLFEVRDATRPISACEMALIRLSYAAELPPTDKLVKDLLDGGAVPAPRGAAPAPSSSPRAPVASGGAMRAPQPQPEGAPSASIRNLEDMVALAAANNAPILRVALENYVHLVHLEPGRIEFRPHARAPRTLAGDLQQKLRDWTGERWAVSIASQGGAPTLAEQKQSAKTARFEAVAQEPMVRAVLDRFPGAEIVAVRDVVSEDIAPAMPESDSDS
ncbi:MAG: DNA polymerase III subunit gamma/tau, partial [Alphaproteobacteria bacterium]